MDDKVKELVERGKYILDVKSSGRCGTERCENYTSCNLCLAEQILSHPDLYIKVPKDTSFEDAWGIWRKRISPVCIPLAEAIKE